MSLKQATTRLQKSDFTLVRENRRSHNDNGFMALCSMARIKPDRSPNRSATFFELYICIGYQFNAARLDGPACRVSLPLSIPDFDSQSKQFMIDKTAAELKGIAELKSKPI